MRIVASQLDEDEPKTHLLMPTQVQGPFLPFDRFAETVATSRMQLGLHAHMAQEVIVYVLDGYVHHEDGEGHHTDLPAGSVLVATAHREIRHELTLQPRQEHRSARWLSIVLRLPWHTDPRATSIQIKEAGDAVEPHDGTIRRPVVGPLARADSAIGVECVEVTFTENADASFPVGRDRRGVAYVLEGSGRVGKESVEPGQGALAEDVANLAIHGSAGLRVFLASVPVTGSEEPYPNRDRPQERLER